MTEVMDFCNIVSNRNYLFSRKSLIMHSSEQLELIEETRTLSTIYIYYLCWNNAVHFHLMHLTKRVYYFADFLKIFCSPQGNI